MKIVINGPPLSKMRPRLGKNIVFDPQTAIKKTVSKAIELQLRDSFNECPEKALNLSSAGSFKVDFTFYFNPPANDSKARRNAKLANEIPCIVKNDLDNLEKFYCDCANGILYKDDHLIVEMSSKKLWGMPRVEMEITPYDCIKSKKDE